MSINVSAWLHHAPPIYSKVAEMEPTGFELYSWNFKGSPLKNDGKGRRSTNFPLVGKVTFQGREPLKLPKGVYIPPKTNMYTQNDAFETVTPFKY